MILVDWEIKEYVKLGYIGIEPFNTDLVQPNSIDVRLADHFIWYSENTDRVINPYSKESIRADAHETHAKEYILKPNQFVLARTLEEIRLPSDIVASIEGKSSIARLGVSLHQTGGWIDAGFNGTITLELYNSNCKSVVLQSGMTIGQIVFQQTKKCELPYNARHTAKYNGQFETTLSRYNLNSDKGDLL